MYRMLSDGSGISTPVGGDNALFLAKLKDISKGLVERWLCWRLGYLRYSNTLYCHCCLSWYGGMCSWFNICLRSCVFLLCRFWTPLPFSEKMSTVYSVLFVGWVVNSMRELNDLEKKIITASQSWGCEKGAGGQNKKWAAWWDASENECVT